MSGKEESSSVKLLEMLEEDDEFEEFDVQDWAPKADDDDEHNWQDDWDDDLADDDFIGHLRKELKL